MTFAYNITDIREILKKLEEDPVTKQPLFTIAPDVTEHATIGWGHQLFTKQEVDDVRKEIEKSPGKKLSLSRLEQFLTEDIAEASAAVNAGLDPEVNAKLNINQRNALICFAFNVGRGGFLNSGIPKILNDNKIDPITKEEKIKNVFLQWGRGGPKGKKRDIAGLSNRRQFEYLLFTKPVIGPMTTIEQAFPERHRKKHQTAIKPSTKLPLRTKKNNNQFDNIIKLANSYYNLAKIIF